MVGPVPAHAVDVRRVATVVDEDDDHLAGAAGHLVEPDDVLEGPLERELVDLLVVVAFLADVDEDLLEAGLEQLRGATLVEQRAVAGHDHPEPLGPGLAAVVDGAAVQQRLTQPAQADADLSPAGSAMAER